MFVQPPTPSPPRPTPVAADLASALKPAPFLTPIPRHHRRTRGASGGSHSTFLLRPPEDSTPIPTSGSLDWTPRPRKVHIPKELMMTPRVALGSMQRSLSSSHSTPDSGLPPLRLSNGKPLKSSLKSTSRPQRPPLSVITSPDGPMRSKSAPATPRVHFDSQLEHVKLFLAEQKPLAVSRDGSPTDDTSADEFPAFIFRPESKGTLVMHRLNFTDTPADAAPIADVALESVSHSPEVPALNGVVRVRNIAFEKRVAIRFTLDNWQTTSEVVARYAGPCAAALATHDRFAFVVKLHDLLPGRERMLLFAIRYASGGRDMWDNNAGKDYRLRFYHELPTLPPAGVAVPATQTPPAMDRQVEDLRARLEAVVRGEDTRGRETVGALIAAHSRHRWTGTPDDTGVEDPPPLRFKAGATLTERYSIASALRDTKDKRRGAHARTSTYPVTSSLPFPSASPGVVDNMPSAYSAAPGNVHLPPRDVLTPGSNFSPRLSPRGDEVPSISPTPRHAAHGRHHSRGGLGYFDIQAVRRTPPTSPTPTPLSITFPSAGLQKDSPGVFLNPSPDRSPSPQPPALSISPSPSPEANSLELPETPDQSGDDDAEAEAEMESESALATPRPAFVARYSQDAGGFAPDWVMPLGKNAAIGTVNGIALEAQLLGAESHEGSRSPSPASRGEIERKDSPVHHLDDYNALLNKCVVSFSGFIERRADVSL
jgi:hypothetical protein